MPIMREKNIDTCKLFPFLVRNFVECKSNSKCTRRLNSTVLYEKNLYLIIYTYIHTYIYVCM